MTIIQRSDRRGRLASVTERRPPSARTRLVWALPLQLLAGFALGACTDTQAPPLTGSVSSTGKVTVADPNAVLTQLANDLRKQIDALTADLAVTERRVGSDRSLVCKLPSDNGWPKQWDYSRGLFLTQPDTRFTIRQMTEHLHGQGWTLQTSADTPTELRMWAQKDGTVIEIAGGSTRGAMVVNGSTACVNSDGTVDHRPVR
jgi:hypothetical protein